MGPGVLAGRTTADLRGRQGSRNPEELSCCPLISSHEADPTRSQRVRKPAIGTAFRGERGGDGLLTHVRMHCDKCYERHEQGGK